jgi:hypothetical protein
VSKDDLRYRLKKLRYGKKDDETMRTPNVPVEIVHVSEVLTPLSEVTDLDSAIVAVGTGANNEIVVECNIPWLSMHGLLRDLPCTVEIVLRCLSSVQ